ncbi:hypothetical protein Ae406Ps2_5221 [Pseudonocardia sp. Ae406_Ps2]|nr:hypothetical protein Ae331Ps2_0739c [Pseudonocardia sp. Ae331_Ps2]OLM05221.1 hypothetical protein Ae406Ps2_5221 [Pseudonocardia sp. Ae406_Ps2]OLM09965.1 hypothetical protein Ae505Ps2_0086c [Pseudonocardia sp. Ae505_Ps2]OLM26789.1 hypothetical protein Ae706Ps2_5222 [Pseudonocardia sp. Ae706_Ps2]
MASATAGDRYRRRGSQVVVTAGWFCRRGPA